MSGKEIREALGFLGVIGSMIFVGLEIRQNNLALTASAIQESVFPGKSSSMSSQRLHMPIPPRPVSLAVRGWDSPSRHGLYRR